jgi:hypothetical protein
MLRDESCEYPIAMSGDQATFRYINSKTGETIATGPLSLLNDQLAAQRTAEGAIKAAALAADRSHRARADALDQRERQIDERERQAFADGVARLTAGISDIARRMDEFERRRDEERLKSEIAEADSALRALGDEGDLEIKTAPELRDAQEIEAGGGNSEAEGAIEKDDDLEGGGPALPAREPEIYRPVEPMGALPFDSKADSDMHEFGRTFLRSADRRAFKRTMMRR